MTVKTLDSIFPEIEGIAGANARFFLKIHTQGYDLEVCKGAPETVARMQGLQSEVSVESLYEGQPDYIDALTFYRGLGFALMNLSIINRATAGRILEYDCLMARPDALAA